MMTTHADSPPLEEHGAVRDAGEAAAAARRRPGLLTGAAAAAWAAAALVTLAIPDQPPSAFIVYEGTTQAGLASAAVAALIALAGIAGAGLPRAGARLARLAPWLIA